ncbi:unnamed protein product [Parajaminaea phylloscopi]
MTPSTSSSHKAFAPEMATQEARIQSFFSTHAPAASSTSTAKSRKTSTPIAWPHPTTSSSQFPSPNHLASLGLFYCPTSTQPDRVVSYVDGTEVSKFEAGDCPEQRLQELQSRDPWLLIMRSKAAGTADDGEDQQHFTYADADLLPDGQNMIQARRRTFADLWPHDGKRGWKPTSQKLAQAGFHYEPTAEDADNASCIYCGRTLSGWEKTDDAIHEHIRKRPDCPFFNCSLLEVDEKPTNSKAKPATRARPTQRSVSAKQSQREADTEEGVGRSASGTERQMTASGSGQAVDPPRQPRSRKASAQKTIASEAETEESDIEVQPRARRTRTKAAPASTSTESLTKVSLAANRPASSSGAKARGRRAVVKGHEEQESTKESDAIVPSEQSDTDAEKPKRRGRPAKASKAKVDKRLDAAEAVITIDSSAGEEETGAGERGAHAAKGKVAAKSGTKRATKQATKASRGKTAALDTGASASEAETESHNEQPQAAEEMARNSEDATVLLPHEADQTAKGSADSPPSARTTKARSAVRDRADAPKEVRRESSDTKEAVAPPSDPSRISDAPMKPVAQASTAVAPSGSDGKPSTTSRGVSKSAAVAAATRQANRVEPEESKQEVDAMSQASGDEKTGTRLAPEEPKASDDQRAALGRGPARPTRGGRDAVATIAEGSILQAPDSHAEPRILSPLPSVNRAPSGRQARAVSATATRKASAKKGASTVALGDDQYGLVQSKENKGPFTRRTETEDEEDRGLRSPQKSSAPQLPPPSPVKPSLYHSPALAPLCELPNLDFAIKAHRPKEATDKGVAADGLDNGIGSLREAAGPAMTVQSYLELQVTLALEEMRQKGEEKVRDLENRLAQSRQQVEKVLRGLA